MKKISLLFIVSVLDLSACAGKSEPKDQPAELQVSDPSKQLEAAVGNEFKIIIDSNPSTGYHWELVNELDKSSVEFVAKDYRGSGEDTMPGSGGVDVWMFKAVAAGETHITLGYYSPSNDPVEPQQTVTFTVTVK